MYDYLFLIRRMGSSESGRLMITPVTVPPAVSSALVWPAMVSAMMVTPLDGPRTDWRSPPLLWRL